MTGEEYSALPWHDIGLSGLAEPKARDGAATTHALLVEASRRGATAADRLRRLGRTVGELYNGIGKADGRAMGEEWVTMLADLARCGPDGIEAWAATYGESTGNWWPPSSSCPHGGL